jgi:glycosyltransferase involved in cell wall biosynthesis
MEPRVRLTALLVVLNGERLLGRCLDSLSFCDRILIVDSFSTDSTEQIARDHGAIFIQNKWPGNAKQVQYGLDWLEANAPTDWVLMLDCDELISRDLGKNIKAALDNPGDKTSFSMPRLTWYFDGFLRHGGCYPDRLFRLFKPTGVRIENSGALSQYGTVLSGAFPTDDTPVDTSALAADAQARMLACFDKPHAVLSLDERWILHEGQPVLCYQAALIPYEINSTGNSNLKHLSIVYLPR